MLGRLFGLFCAFFMLTVLAIPGAAQAVTASGKVTTNHWKQGTGEGYTLTATATIPSTLARLATMTLTGPEIVTPVALTEDASGTTYSATITLAARPSVGTAYTVNATYFDSETSPTPADTLILPVSNVLDDFATPATPNGGVGGTTNPTFTWQAPAQLPAGYRLSIFGLDEAPWVSAQTGTLSAQYLPTAAEKTAGYPALLVAGTAYIWSVYSFDADGNSTENRDGTVMIGANISGRVTDFSGAAMAGATVNVYNTLDQAVTSATTGADGSYLIGGLSTTSYRLKFSKLVNGVLKTVYYNNRFDASDNLAVNASTLQTGIDAVLGGWGSIAGKVVNSSGVNLSGVRVELLNENGSATGSAVNSKTDGTFSFVFLTPGTYRVKCIGTPLGYADLTYENQLLVTEGALSQLPTNAVLNRINITGTVTNLSGAPLAGINVFLYTTANEFVPNFFGVQTGADGSYAISGIGVGSYKVLFDPPSGSSYVKQYYNRKTLLSQADAVTIFSTTTPVTGINAVLGTGRPEITAFIVPASSPSLTVSGITFTAVEAAGVAGYLINESATTPAADAAGWRTTPPTSYTFAEVGEKTLYAWAKGTTGLVSASIARSVSVQGGPLTPGDSDGDGVITIAEVKLALDMYLKLEAPARFVDADGDDAVTLLEVQRVINAFLAVQ